MVAMSFVVYLPEVLSIWLAVKAVGVTLGLGNLLVLTGAASLATLLPAGPAFLGTLQLAYALTMQFIGEPAAHRRCRDIRCPSMLLSTGCYHRGGSHYRGHRADAQDVAEPAQSQLVSAKISSCKSISVRPVAALLTFLLSRALVGQPL